MIHLNIKLFMILAFIIYLNVNAKTSMVCYSVISRHTYNIAKCSLAMVCSVCESWPNWRVLLIGTWKEERKWVSTLGENDTLFCKTLLYSRVLRERIWQINYSVFKGKFDNLISFSFPLPSASATQILLVSQSSVHLQNLQWHSLQTWLHSNSQLLCWGWKIKVMKECFPGAWKVLVMRLDV